MSKNRPHEEINKRCGAKTKKGTPCRNPAGFRTNHVGKGRCFLHGGLSTGPKNKTKMNKNKNAVTTGEYESIIVDVLEDEEKNLFYKISLNELKQINDEIRLTDIRLRRMMLRIKELQQKEYFPLTQKKGTERDAETNIAEAENPLIQIQNIEDAITRIQAHKLKLLDSKHKLEQNLGIVDETKKAQLEHILAKTEKLKGVSSNIEDMSELRRLLLDESD